MVLEKNFKEKVSVPRLYTELILEHAHVGEFPVHP